MPIVRSILHVTPGWSLEFQHKRPNAFRRFWQWLLLGWRWEEPKPQTFIGGICTTIGNQGEK